MIYYKNDISICYDFEPFNFEFQVKYNPRSHKKKGPFHVNQTFGSDVDMRNDTIDLIMKNTITKRRCANLINWKNI